MHITIYWYAHVSSLGDLFLVTMTLLFYAAYKMEGSCRYFTLYISFVTLMPQYVSFVIFALLQR